MWTKSQGVRAADAAMQSYRAQRDELDGERTAIVKDLALIEQQRREAFNEAAALLLPDAEWSTLRALPGRLASWFSARRKDLEPKRAEWQARREAIENDRQFIDRRTLLHHTQGTFAVELRQLAEMRARAEADLTRFRTPTFDWLQQRNLQREMKRGALAGFWDVITFGGYREDSAKERCAKELGFATYEEVIAQHQRLTMLVAQSYARAEQIKAQRNQLLSRIDTYGKLVDWTDNFESKLCDRLRSEAVEMFEREELGALHDSAPGDIKKIIAKAHALGKKHEYLSNLELFLRREINDRDERIAAIRKTRVTWALRPSERIAGNKTAWLITGPEQKHRATHKNVRFARRMHHNIVEYEDYDDYAYYYAHNRSFLPYDAFAWGAEEPMPYEGFARNIVAEVGRYRAEHHQERADFGLFKGLDKDAAREEREAQRAADKAAREAERAEAEEASRDAEAETLAEAAAIAEVESYSDNENLSEAEASIETEDAGDSGAGDESS